MNVKAKFRCRSVTEFAGGDKEVKFNAIYSGTGENADFAKATPAGELSIVINAGTKAAELFKPGVSYYLSFEEAPEELTSA